MQARGLSGQDVANALAAQNLMTPVGTEKIGDFEYAINLNNAPSVISELGDLPIKSANGGMVYVRDVAHVRDGNPPQSNIVHVNGNRSVLMVVLKNGGASTLAVIDGIKKKYPELQRTLPGNLKIAEIADQSFFVKAAIGGVVREGVIAAALTSLMILLFLGSFRSTLIIATSIPLSVLGSLATLWALGETLNIMTLGGLALAVGILVDEATVTIENVNWHLEQGKEVETAIMDGAQQIVTPAFVSMLCICIVFVPMFFLTGVPRFLFVPLAEAVMSAMIWSFILSRTLVPTMAKYMLRRHASPAAGHGLDAPLPPSRNPLVFLQRAFARRFERFRFLYRELLTMALRHRAAFVTCFLAAVIGTFALVPYLGRDFFPNVDGGQILIHVRAHVGMRVEESARLFATIEKAVRQVVPPHEVAELVDNIGFPISSINKTYNNTGTIGKADGEIQIKLAEGHRPTREYLRALREELPARFPGTTFSFLPADIVSQILNFGAPAPIEVQIRGPHLDENFAYAEKLLHRLRHIPGLVDARIQQSLNAPAFDVNVDRTRAQYVGITERDVTNSMVVNLAGSGQVQPTYWLNPANGVSYSIVLQTPEYQVDSLNALQNLPITAPGAAPQTLGAIADIKRVATPAVYSQYDIQPVIQLYATTQDRDLGAVAADVQMVVQETAEELPKTARVVMLGQVKTMNNSFFGLLLRSAWRHCAHLSADSGQLPVLGRSVRDHHRAARRPCRHRLDTLRHAHDVVGACTHRRHHVHGRRHRQQRARRQLRQGEAGRAWRCRRRGDRSRICPLAAGADDCARHDHRHAADGPWLGRRRRAECAARPRRGRRSLFRDGCDADVRTGCVQYHPPAPRAGRRARDRRTACRLIPPHPHCRGADSTSPGFRRRSSPS